MYRVLQLWNSGSSINFDGIKGIIDYRAICKYEPHTDYTLTWLRKW